MSALTDQWLLVHAASVKAQNAALDIESAQLEGDVIQKELRVAAFQAIQTAQITDLDTKIQALQVLLAAL